MKSRVEFKKLLTHKYPTAQNRFEKEDYRLQEYLQYSDEELAAIENILWEITLDKVSNNSPVNKYKNFEYIGSGWEFSVFKVNDYQVCKIPAGIFKEVNSSKYFSNIQKIYDILTNKFGEKFIPKTEIDIEHKIIYQDYVNGKDQGRLGYNTKNAKKLQQLHTFVRGLKDILSKFDWMPDVNIRRERGGFKLSNVIIDSEDNLKFYDFSVLYNVFRIYPSRTKDEVKIKGDALDDLLSWIELRT